MEIREIRIGNRIEYLTVQNPDRWEEIVVSPVTFGRLSMEPLRFRPIELTPEWLTKLGWGKSEEHEMGHNAYEPWGFYYDYHFKRFRIENSDTDWDVEMPNVKYLHQVQNLIFSLTGEELAIDKTSLKN